VAVCDHRPLGRNNFRLPSVPSWRRETNETEIWRRDDRLSASDYIEKLLKRKASEQPGQVAAEDAVSKDSSTSTMDSGVQTLRESTLRLIQRDDADEINRDPTESTPLLASQLHAVRIAETPAEVVAELNQDVVEEIRSLSAPRGAPLSKTQTPPPADGVLEAGRSSEIEAVFSGSTADDEEAGQYQPLRRSLRHVVNVASGMSCGLMLAFLLWVICVVLFAQTQVCWC